MGQAGPTSHIAGVTRDKPSDLYITGVERIEALGGGMVRFVLYVMHNGERVAAEHDVVISLEALPDAIGKAMMACGRLVLAKPDGSLHVIQ